VAWQRVYYERGQPHRGHQLVRARRETA